MRRKHTYGLAFLAVFAAALAGFLLARRFVGPIELPRLDAIAQAETIFGEIDINSLIPRRTPQPKATSDAPTTPAGSVIVEPVATSTPLVTDALAAEDVAVAPSLPTAQGDLQPPAEETPASDAAPTPSQPAPTPTEVVDDPGYGFVTAGPVRHGTTDCPGVSIRGMVRDAQGAPLRAVRLWRYDQWGNEQVIESKTSDVDAGQYDFPLGDTPNVHYVQIIDSGGAIISPVIEIQHRQGDAPDATCHWLDWVQR